MALEENVQGPNSQSVRRAWCAAAAALLAVCLVAGLPRSGWAAPGMARTAGARPAVLQESGAPLTAENASEVSRQSVQEPFWYSIARLVNFAILAGVLVYYLRAPIARYVAQRSTEIRANLVKAAETREAAAAQLAEIERKMKALPAEIEALKARGAEEIRAEEARIREAAEHERRRLLEQARREIDLHLRAAERDLIKRAADLTVDLATDRIKQTITDQDQQRLVERYLAQVQK